MYVYRRRAASRLLLFSTPIPLTQPLSLIFFLFYVFFRSTLPLAAAYLYIRVLYVILLLILLRLPPLLLPYKCYVYCAYTYIYVVNIFLPPLPSSSNPQSRTLYAVKFIITAARHDGSFFSFFNFYLFKRLRLGTRTSISVRCACCER